MGVVSVSLLYRPHTLQYTTFGSFVASTCAPHTLASPSRALITCRHSRRGSSTSEAFTRYAPYTPCTIRHVTRSTRMVSEAFATHARNCIVIGFASVSNVPIVLRPVTVVPSV